MKTTKFCAIGKCEVLQDCLATPISGWLLDALMAYVITEPCIDVKDGDCTTACPVDCIYEGGRMFYIHPDECINCGLCLSVCPVDAIVYDQEMLESQRLFIAANRDFFGDKVTGWGAPGGWDKSLVSREDHPLVAGFVPVPTGAVPRP